LVVSLRRAPTWIWLVVLVLASFAVRAWLARDMVAPFIMVDELIYAELARSFADTGQLAVRGVPTQGYSIVYPVLISPAYALFDGLTDAYAAVKTMNSLFMSLAAVPAYLLARRVVGPGLGLLSGVLAVSLPSLVYTGTVMTENVFYPVFLTAMLLLTLVLERPTAVRQTALFVVVGIACATRVQAVALVLAILTAPLLLALFRREDLRVALRRYLSLYVVALGGGLVAIIAQLARGRSVSDLLGAYSIVGESDYHATDVLRYFLYHVAELDLYLGVVPVAATIVLVGRVRSMDGALQIFLAAVLAATFWIVLAVSAFASVFAQRIQERNTFVVVPLFLVLLLAWVDRGAMRPRALAFISAVVAVALILAIPFERLITTSAISDTLLLLPWWNVQDLVTLEWVAELALALAVMLGAAFLLVPRRYALALPLVVLAYYGIVFQPIWAGKHGVRQASAGALFQGIRGVPRDWIDKALPPDREAAILWTGRADRLTVNENEFFNRGVGQVYYTSYPTPGGVGETLVRIDPDDGVVRLPDGDPVRSAYVVADGTLTPDGTALARDSALGTTLWRVIGNLVSTTTVRGLYPNDTWSGRTVTWTRRHCRGGKLVVSLSTDASLFDAGQTVTAAIGRRVVARTRLDPTGTAELVVPLVEGLETCIVGFRVSPTAVPAQVLPESVDRRVLGAHFNAFTYEPAQ
jgi:hypothetical protein